MLNCKREIVSYAKVIPGTVLSALVALISLTIQYLEERMFGHPYVEGLVFAILLGAAIRTAWKPSNYWRTGIAFSAKQVLEVAVTLLGASISLSAIVNSGPTLFVVTVCTVGVVLLASYGISRFLGLSVRLSILIACGNSVCGNSAIAAVAPVIGADADDIASSISFTAVLGVIMVLMLPLLIPLFGLSPTQYGVLAGLTVYAVPQVLAATVPVGLLSTQIGTLVKLIRVLTLGPIVVGFSLLSHKFRQDNLGRSIDSDRIRLYKMVPWFILGFVTLAGLRSLGLLPNEAVAPLLKAATLLTIVSMAALGLGVDLRVIGDVGGRVTAAVTLSLLLLLIVSLGIVHSLYWS